MPGLFDSRLKLRHLQCLLALASHGSVLKAAEFLVQTPSAVSKTLAELEELLDVQLFERKRAGLKITPAGETLLDYASQALGILQEGIAAVDEGRISSPPLNVGVLPTVTSNILPQAILRLCAEYPDIVITVHTGINSSLLKQLKLGELDLVIGRLGDPTEMYGVSFEPLYTEPLVLAVRAGHPLVSIVPQAPEISAYPLILPVRGTMIRNDVERFLISSGIGMSRQRIESISNTMGRSLLQQSDAIWFCSLGVIADDLAKGQAVQLDVPTQSTTASVGLSTLSEAPSSIALSHFMRAIRAAAVGRGHPFVDSSE